MSGGRREVHKSTSLAKRNGTSKKKKEKRKNKIKKKKDKKEFKYFFKFYNFFVGLQIPPPKTHFAHTKKKGTILESLLLRVIKTSRSIHPKQTTTTKHKNQSHSKPTNQKLPHKLRPSIRVLIPPSLRIHFFHLHIDFSLNQLSSNLSLFPF